MDAPVFFFTGIPGFLGTETLPRLLRQVPAARAVLLIQAKFVDPTRSLVDQWDQADDLRGRISIVTGDLTQTSLGLTLEELTRLQGEVTQIFHFAAVYDLAVRRELAEAINVGGTKRMIEFARGCSKLERFHYVSTCYVSGRHPGQFRESDLRVEQTFNNFYEETKYEAEVEVQNARAAGLPAVIYRPSIVVGNSQTGETQKYDGPYYVIQLALKLPLLALPKLGDPTRITLNLVPSDFVVDALCRLSQHPRAVGQVFHLADPRPPTIQKVVEVISRWTGRKAIWIPLPAGLTKSLLLMPGLKQWLKVPPQLLDYFTQPTQYEAEITGQFLRELGMSAPTFPDYAEVIVNFVKTHPDLRSQAMV